MVLSCRLVIELSRKNSLLFGLAGSREFYREVRKGMFSFNETRTEKLGPGGTTGTAEGLGGGKDIGSVASRFKVRSFRP